MTTLLPLDEVLGIADECGVSNLDQQPEGSVLSREVVGPREVLDLSKKRLPRLQAEIVSLRAQLRALMIQLKSIKQTRSTGADLLLVHASYWRTEAHHLSRQRAVAQEENERLRSQLRAQRRFATRLVNMMKRQPSIRVRRASLRKPMRTNASILTFLSDHTDAPPIRARCYCARPHERRWV